MQRIKRPRVVASLSVRITTGCGNMYVQMGWWNGSVHEIFATLGKGGGCAAGYSEGLTRSISAGLRYGVPASEFARQLRGVRCPEPRPFPPEESVLSCVDAIARALRQYGSLDADTMIQFVQDLNDGSFIEPAEEQPGGVVMSAEELAEEEAEAAKQLATMKAERRALESTED